MTDPAVTDDPVGGAPVVYELAPDCAQEALTEGSYYLATVDGVVDYGVFVELADSLSGLMHDSVLTETYEPGERLVVELTAIKDNGDLSFAPVPIEDYDLEWVAPDYDPIDLADLPAHEGDLVHVEGVVVGIKQTGGPTLFSVADGAGVVPCAAFERAGVRAYPAVALEDYVHVVGEVTHGDHGRQIEVDALEPLDGDRADAARERFETTLAETATPHDVEPLVDWPALSAQKPGLEAVADRLRRAVLEGRPVLIRHHADTDGICASVPVERALEGFIEGTHAAADAARHTLVRLPSKAPYYDIEDVTRDLSRLLADRERHGRRLPLLLMIDNGSTAEDVPAYKQLDTYDVPVVVIDHHSPDPDAVEPYVVEHVNPYLHGEDYRITAGMLCVELARMIDPSLTDSLKHVPAVAGLADRSTADEMAAYLDLADRTGYDLDRLHAVGDAVDYTAHWLRYDDGRGLIDRVIGIDGSEFHAGVVEFLAADARRAIERQLDATLEHVETESLSNGATLHRIDLEQHAHRFTYPAPGTTTGAIHDHMVSSLGEPAITIGIGPDFAVLRSDGVRLDIPAMVTDLNDDLAGAGVSGGGHLVVGSIRFVEGMREPVLDALIGTMATAAIDESLGSAAPRVYRSDGTSPG